MLSTAIRSPNCLQRLWQTIMLCPVVFVTRRPLSFAETPRRRRFSRVRRFFKTQTRQPCHSTFSITSISTCTPLSLENRPETERENSLSNLTKQQIMLGWENANLSHTFFLCMVQVDNGQPVIMSGHNKLTYALYSNGNTGAALEGRRR